MGVDFDQRRRSTLHNAVHGLLREIAADLEVSLNLEEIIEEVVSVVHGACAEFSETWNGRHAYPLARRLPVEVMTECFLLADFQTRVLASHVSRGWRRVALADCRLWTNYRVTPFTSLLDQAVATDRLTHMIWRSRPLPFKLQLPYSGYRGFPYYAAHVFNALRADTHRLVEYEGPAEVFREALWMPDLVYLTCRDAQRNSPLDNDVLIIRNVFQAHGAVNLRTLVAPVLDFVNAPLPYRSLQHLVCHLRPDVACDRLFRFFPNLTTVVFRGIKDDTVLPPGPIPDSLQHVTLRVPADLLETADFGAVLQPWMNLPIHRLSLFRADDIEPLIPLFLASHNLPVKLTTYFDDSEADIILTSVPDGEFRWEIGTHGVWEGYDCFHAFRVLCAERLTALSIPLNHLWACCDVRTHAPNLVDIEIRLAGREEVGFPWEGPEQAFYLRAPRLCRVVLDIDDSFWDCTMIMHEATIFDTLDQDFRSLLVYDAELLDSIAVRCAARHLESFSHHDFSRFAKTYSLDTQ